MPQCHADAQHVEVRFGDAAELDPERTAGKARQECPTPIKCFAMRLLESC